MGWGTLTFADGMQVSGSVTFGGQLHGVCTVTFKSGRSRRRLRARHAQAWVGGDGKATTMDQQRKMEAPRRRSSARAPGSGPAGVPGGVGGAPVGLPRHHEEHGGDGDVLLSEKPGVTVSMRRGGGESREDVRLTLTGF